MCETVYEVRCDMGGAGISALEQSMIIGIISGMTTGSGRGWHPHDAWGTHQAATQIHPLQHYMSNWL
jgi:hypothetical protein